jgi:hypothetical protein
VELKQVWNTGTAVKDARFEDKNTARKLVILGIQW